MTDLENALNNKVAPWTEIEYRCKTFWIFRDKYPVSEGHLLFVPVYENTECLMECYKAAYKWGYDGIELDRWEGFNIGQNIGASAGQTVMYPHVHMIPRRNGDCTDPRGGVRHVIPGKGNYLASKNDLSDSEFLDDLLYRLRKRAEIRRQIPTRKSVQEGRPDRLADLLEEAATELERLQQSKPKSND